jgi:hypothetical protein
MKYDDNKSGINLLKKMFIKFNKHGGKFSLNSDHSRRLMAEIYGALSDDLKKEYTTWEEIQKFKLEVQREMDKINEN